MVKMTNTEELNRIKAEVKKELDEATDELINLKRELEETIKKKDSAKSKAEDGFFDNVMTWQEAIKRLNNFKSKWAYEKKDLYGHFEEIDGFIYFKLNIPNDKLTRVILEQALLSENYLMAHRDYKRQSKPVKTDWEKMQDK